MRKLKYISEINLLRTNKEKKILDAGRKLTKAIGNKIRVFYNLLVREINDRIDKINLKTSKA